MISSSFLSKIANLCDTHNSRIPKELDMETQCDERRQEFRHSSNERLFIQIVASNDPYLVGTTVSCTAINVSANGLRVEAASKIPKGCRLDIWVDVATRPGKFFLTSEVKWSQPIGDGLCQIGVALSEGATTDIAEWRKVHTH